MCLRYSLTSPPEARRATFAYRDTPNFPARYNIAPTQDIGVVCVDSDGQRRFRMMRWGLLPPFIKDRKAEPPMINARAEGISTKSAFRRAFAERRCLGRRTGSMNGPGPRVRAAPFCFARAKAA
jgi:putative SOS response-associated peptidase YedK